MKKGKGSKMINQKKAMNKKEVKGIKEVEAETKVINPTDPKLTTKLEKKKDFEELIKGLEFEEVIKCLLKGYERLMIEQIKVIKGQEKEGKGIDKKVFIPKDKDKVFSVFDQINPDKLGETYLREGLKIAQKELQLFWEEKKIERRIEKEQKKRAREAARIEINSMNWEILGLDVDIYKLFNKNDEFTHVFSKKQIKENKIKKLEGQVSKLMKEHKISHDDLSGKLSDEPIDKPIDKKKKDKRKKNTTKKKQEAKGKDPFESKIERDVLYRNMQ